MKRALLCVMCLTVSVFAPAQTQEMQQLKLDLEKLAQLKLMLSQLRQGYQTLQSGFNAVSNAAKGNFTLHKSYLDNLLRVSAAVKNTPALKRLFNNQGRIASEYKAWYPKIQALQVLQPDELSAIQQQYQIIRSGMDDDLSILQTVLSTGQLRMSEAERISFIETLANKSDGRLQDTRKLMKEQTDLAASRVQHKRDVDAVRGLYGLH